MKLLDVLIKDYVAEANVGEKIIKDPRMVKQLAIAWKHDSTLPLHVKARLGPEPLDEKKKAEWHKSIVDAWSKLLDNTLRRNDYGDLSVDGKFDDWLTRLYINGQADYEDINGEGGDALGAWKALSIRGKLKPQDQDFNKFKSIQSLQRIKNDHFYRGELEKIKDAEKIEKMKREALQVVIYDDGRFNAIVPLNFGACYARDKGEGFTPNFCTSSSSGSEWWKRYSPQGIIINLVDRENLNDKNGKWQMHAITGQLRNAVQDNRHDDSINDENFSKLFPGLMKKLGDGLSAHAEEIRDGSKEFVRGGGYDIENEINLLKDKFPKSWNSKVEEPEGEQSEEDNTGPGTYLVTQIETGRTARIVANSRAHAEEQLLSRYPQFNLDDYRFELIRDEQ